MDGYEVKKVMDQVHISPEMQEGLIRNIQDRMEQGNRSLRAWNFRRMATAAAAFVMAAGVISFPVRAVVSSMVQERMESVPAEEMKGLNDMVQSQHDVQADGFSRAYSAMEKERSQALWKAYESGTFPEKVIEQAETAADAAEGALCYIKSTGVFQLPAQEMTDEEMLQIIDFQHKMSYAVTQASATPEARAEYAAEEARLKKMVQDANGISGDEAVEIAKKQLKTDLGAQADGLELMTDTYGSGATLMDIRDYDYVTDMGIQSKAGVVYDVGFGNPDTHSTYGYLIDAVDGSILYQNTYTPGSLE